MAIIYVHPVKPGKTQQFFPYKIMVNGKPYATTSKDDVGILIQDAGEYLLKICIYPFMLNHNHCLSSSVLLSVAGNDKIKVSVASGEYWWNVLFNIDLVLCILVMFLNLPDIIDTIYDYCSNIVFAVWVAHFWFKRNNFFKIKVTN